MRAWQYVSCVLLSLGMMGCSTSEAPKSAASEYFTVSIQPPNVGDAKIEALKYHDSGDYDRDVRTVATEAQNWLDSRSGSVGKMAAVFDIDETALSNWEVIKRDDFGRPVAGPCHPGIDPECGWAAWDLLGKDPAIAPTLELYRDALAKNVAIFFITGRPESQRRATARNLTAAGCTKYEHLYLVPKGAHFASAADFKAPIRAKIEQAGYMIILNIGDQPSDLLGGHAERSFLLPDPFYRVP
jgi:predicted secreted acid phosphatase